jgi:hypothetical protein
MRTGDPTPGNMTGSRRLPVTAASGGADGGADDNCITPAPEQCAHASGGSKRVGAATAPSRPGRAWRTRLQRARGAGRAGRDVGMQRPSAPAAARGGRNRERRRPRCPRQGPSAAPRTASAPIAAARQRTNMMHGPPSSARQAANLAGRRAGAVRRCRPLSANAAFRRFRCKRQGDCSNCHHNSFTPAAARGGVRPAVRAPRSRGQNLHCSCVFESPTLPSGIPRQN